MAHLYVLISGSVEQAWISQNGSRSAAAPTDVRTVDIHRVHAYLAKYLTKDLLLLLPAKKKRISPSPDAIQDDAGLRAFLACIRVSEISS